MKDKILPIKLGKLSINGGYIVNEKRSPVFLRGVDAPLLYEWIVKLSDVDLKRLRVWGFNWILSNIYIEDLKKFEEEIASQKAENHPMISYMNVLLDKLEEWDLYLSIKLRNRRNKNSTDSDEQILKMLGQKFRDPEFNKVSEHKQFLGLDVSGLQNKRHRLKMTENYCENNSSGFIIDGFNVPIPENEIDEESQRILSLAEKFKNRIACGLNSEYDFGTIRNGKIEALLKYEIGKAAGPFRLDSDHQYRVPLILDSIRVPMNNAGGNAFKKWKRGKNEFFVWVDDDNISHIGSYKKWKRWRNKAFSNQDDIFNSVFNAVDDLLLHSVIFNYTPFNSNRFGDQWCDGDYSIYSKDQEVDSAADLWYMKGPKEYSDEQLEFEENRYSGARGHFGFIRPFPRSVGGVPVSASHDWKNSIYDFTFKPNDGIDEQSQFFVPNIQFLYRYVQICEGGWARRDYMGESVWVEPKPADQRNDEVELKILGMQSLNRYSMRQHLQRFMMKLKEKFGN